MRDFVPVRKWVGGRFLRVRFPFPPGEKLLHPFRFPFHYGKGLGVRLLAIILIAVALDRYDCGVAGPEWELRVAVLEQDAYREAL
jgi:hypothetical protein